MELPLCSPPKNIMPRCPVLTNVGQVVDPGHGGLAPDEEHWRLLVDDLDDGYVLHEGVVGSRDLGEQVSTLEGLGMNPGACLSA